ncbi:MAG TPA: acetyltransferase [Terriglobales bacterium]|nr:acetyltransferase [Terriglobales bacterium]
MIKPVVVYGAGGHGKVIAEILLASGQQIAAFLDDNSALSGSHVLGFPVFPAAAWLQQNAGAQVALGIGDNFQRERAANQIASFDGKLITAIHPSAIVARSACIGAGVVIMPGAVLNPECHICDGAILNTGAIVEHDVRIGRYVHLAPGCVTSGGVQVGDFAQIGIGAVVIPGKRIGNHAVIGAGAVVIDDIPPNVVASGVPARAHSQRQLHIAEKM